MSRVTLGADCSRTSQTVNSPLVAHSHRLEHLGGLEQGSSQPCLCSSLICSRTGLSTQTRRAVRWKPVPEGVPAGEATTG